MRRSLSVVALLASCVVAPLAWSHAFPEKSAPQVGATLTAAPQEVKIWFDGEIEPVFSTLVVKDAAGQQISTGKGEVDAKNKTLLETRLTSRASGTDTVYWSVIAHDGHHTEGHFQFTVR